MHATIPGTSPQQYYICKECDAALMKDKVPPGSYVRFDPGTIPTVLPELSGILPSDKEPLTLLESLCVAPARPFRNVFVFRAASERGRPADTLQKVMNGHVIGLQHACRDLPGSSRALFWMVHMG